MSNNILHLAQVALDATLFSRKLNKNTIKVTFTFPINDRGLTSNSTVPVFYYKELFLDTELRIKRRKFTFYSIVISVFWQLQLLVLMTVKMFPILIF